MSAKYFPITTATSCQLKWTWSTIRLYDGTTSSCHRVNSDPIIPGSFSTFHNSPKKLLDRQIMLNGQWPSGGCEYCKNIEDAGGSSDRMFHIKIPDLTPPELDNDPNSIEVTPRIVEVYFDNVCNMSCLYCWDGFSSKIQQENKKFGRFDSQGVIIDNLSKPGLDRVPLTQEFWEWFTLNAHHVKRLHVLGGEPFFQIHFQDCIDFFSKNPCPELEFNVVTNLKVSKSKLKLMSDQIKNLLRTKHLKRFDLTASIDCFGPEQEYVRFGMDLDQWKENFQLLVDDYNFFTLNINQTLSGLTIKTIPELLKFINRCRSKCKIGHYFSTTVMTHKFLHPGIFGPGFFSTDFDAILQEMPADDWQQKEARNYMQGIKLQIDNCQRDNNAIRQLGVFLDEIDRRRGLNWHNTFPWLKREIECVV